MADTSAVARPATAQHARRLAGLRRASLITLFMLIVQFGVGIGVNLYVTLPAAGSGGRPAGQAFSSGPGLALHVVIGLLLVVSAIGLLVQAIMARHGPVIAAAALGLVGIVVAAGQGFSFVHDSTNAASMGMAGAGCVALLCYAVVLYLARPPGRQSCTRPARLPALNPGPAGRAEPGPAAGACGWPLLRFVLASRPGWPRQDRPRPPPPLPGGRF